MYGPPFLVLRRASRSASCADAFAAAAAASTASFFVRSDGSEIREERPERPDQRSVAQPVLVSAIRRVRFACAISSSRSSGAFLSPWSSIFPLSTISCTSKTRHISSSTIRRHSASSRARRACDFDAATAPPGVDSPERSAGRTWRRREPWRALSSLAVRASRRFFAWRCSLAWIMSRTCAAVVVDARPVSSTE